MELNCYRDPKTGDIYVAKTFSVESSISTSEGNAIKEKAKSQLISTKIKNENEFLPKPVDQPKSTSNKSLLSLPSVLPVNNTQDLSRLLGPALSYNELKFQNQLRKLLKLKGRNDFIDVSQTPDDTKDKIPTLTEVIQPLYQYFVDNKCLICGFESKSKCSFSAKQHLVTHLTSRNFKCDVCGKMFHTPVGLSSHKTVHIAEHPFSCSKCSKKFKRKYQLAKHMNTHMKYVYKCLFCDQTFKSSQNRRNHQTIHTGEQPYQCCICNEKFRTSHSLQTHSFKHNPEKNYNCNICGKGYNNKDLLVGHLNSHSKSNQFECDVCQKAFNFKSNLLQHKLVHSDVRRHTCETCGMKFKFPHHLKSHISTHDVL